MKTSGAIVLLLLYLTVNTEFHQVLKIPALFTHYAEHQQQNRAVQFIDFLILHYAGEDVKDADYDQDQQLPFKNSHCIQNSIFIGIPPEKISAPSIPLFTVSQKQLTALPPFATSSFRFSIWQPPKA